MTTPDKEPRLPFWAKLIFGTGDWSTASFGTLRQLFYAIFLTDVVGLEPRLASFVAFIGLFSVAMNSLSSVAFALFLVIRSMNRLKKKSEAPPAAPTTKDCPFCATAIPIKAVRCPHCTSEIGGQK